MSEITFARKKLKGKGKEITNSKATRWGMKKEQDHMMVIYDEKRESQTEKDREKKNDIDNSIWT